MAVAHLRLGADLGVHASYLWCWTIQSNSHKPSIARDEQGPHTPGAETRRLPESSQRGGPRVLDLRCAQGRWYSPWMYRFTFKGIDTY